MTAQRSPSGSAPQTSAGKLIRVEDFPVLRQAYRARGKRVVWTNGCFDMLHEGHILSLESARKLGDVLVVGLNSDRSIRELKGPERPILPASSRAAVLGAMACVDHLVIFDGKRCTRELELIQPDVYAQGSDYTLETIDQDERRAVESHGAAVAFLPLVANVSTSNAVKKIRRSDPEKVISAAFALIRDDAGRLLMVANRYGDQIKWGLPGGGHLRNEPLTATVCREVEEETGLLVRTQAYRGIIERVDPGMNLHLIAHQFEASVTGGSLSVRPDEEHVIEARFLTADQIRALDGVVLGRQHLLTYLASPQTYPPYIFMGPGEE